MSEAVTACDKMKLILSFMKNPSADPKVNRGDITRHTYSHERPNIITKSSFIKESGLRSWKFVFLIIL
jgi:hypothetical protein